MGVFLTRHELRIWSVLWAQVLHHIDREIIPQLHRGTREGPSAPCSVCPRDFKEKFRHHRSCSALTPPPRDPETNKVWCVLHPRSVQDSVSTNSSSVLQTVLQVAMGVTPQVKMLHAAFPAMTPEREHLQPLEAAAVAVRFRRCGLGVQLAAGLYPAGRGGTRHNTTM